MTNTSWCKSKKAHNVRVPQTPPKLVAASPIFVNPSDFSFSDTMSEAIDYETLHEKLPGLRDYSGAGTSHDGHALDEILDVINQLSAAGIPSCVVGVRVLRYYGAGRITDVHIVR
jgi:hypothetical protein